MVTAAVAGNERQWLRRRWRWRWRWRWRGTTRVHKEWHDTVTKHPQLEAVNRHLCWPRPLRGPLPSPFLPAPSIANSCPSPYLVRPTPRDHFQRRTSVRYNVQRSFVRLANKTTTNTKTNIFEISKQSRDLIVKTDSMWRNFFSNTILR